jgi:hypothetical protein
VRRRFVVLPFVAAAFAGVGPSTAAPDVPTAVAIVGTGAKRALVRVDARTLEPVRGSRKIRLPRGAMFALSPNSSRAAIATGSDFFIADTTSGRVVLRPANGGDASEGLYWVGTSADPLVIAVGVSKFGWEYTAVPRDGGSTDSGFEPVAALRGLLVLSGEGALELYGRDETDIDLDSAPAGNFRVVADVAHDRVFVVFNAGVVAEVVGTAVTYHHVGLNGRDFQAIWAGHGQIALWGADGLGIIDTRTWQTRALAPAATGAVATRYGIVTWSSNAADGVAVYVPNGERRLHVLTKKQVVNVTALGRYAYARDTEGSQYAIDLKTGRVRRIRADAELVVPTLVAIP